MRRFGRSRVRMPQHLRLGKPGSILGEVSIKNVVSFSNIGSVWIRQRVQALGLLWSACIARHRKADVCGCIL